MSRGPKDLAASVRQRLLNRSAREAIDFQVILTRYGIERLLYRISRSRYSDRFVLKGAMLFSAWEGWSPRPTRDVDLLSRGENSPAYLKSIFEAICQVEVEPDGVMFDPKTIEIAAIRADQENGGQRVNLTGNLGQARVDVQVDIGFGDAVFPPPVPITFPVLLDLPAPVIMAYSRETVVAEKFHALVTLGMANSRMKDFYDLWLLGRHFAFDGATLAKAIRSTFGRRQTLLSNDVPLALTAGFYDETAKRTMWQAFLTRNRLEVGNKQLEEVIELLREFLLPPARAAAVETMFKQNWPAGGPWK